jgi:fumarate reductase iron-sulfur subunit
MKINIQRYCKHRTPKKTLLAEYELPKKVNFLLEALTYIKENLDPTLAYNSGCRSGVCGSCAMRVNGKEVLACEYKIQENDEITPLDKIPVIKDLVVDHNFSQDSINRAKTFFNRPSKILNQNREDEKMIEKQTDCILCSSCFSSCPVLEVDSEFLGPFALTRAYRYVSDSRNEDSKEIIDKVQNKGVWDCTLCGECTLVCPQGIDPKNDILMLRMKSVQAGYSDPTFASGDDMFGGGFDPSF